MAEARDPREDMDTDITQERQVFQASQEFPEPQVSQEHLVVATNTLAVPEAVVCPILVLDHPPPEIQHVLFANRSAHLAERARDTGTQAASSSVTTFVQHHHRLHLHHLAVPTLIHASIVSLAEFRASATSTATQHACHRLLLPLHHHRFHHAQVVILASTASSMVSRVRASVMATPHASHRFLHPLHHHHHHRHRNVEAPILALIASSTESVAFASRMVSVSNPLLLLHHHQLFSHLPSRRVRLVARVARVASSQSRSRSRSPSRSQFQHLSL